jgi:hypothetical protein
MKTALVLVSAAAALGGAGAPEHGRYSCRISGNGTCTTGPDGICLGTGYPEGRGPVLLKLDMDKKTASLSGLEAIIEASDSGEQQLRWRHVSALNYPTLRWDTSSSALRLELRSPAGDGASSIRVSTFHCRQDNASFGS